MCHVMGHRKRKMRTRSLLLIVSLVALAMMGLGSVHARTSTRHQQTRRCRLDGTFRLGSEIG